MYIYQLCYFLNVFQMFIFRQYFQKVLQCVWHCIPECWGPSSSSDPSLNWKFENNIIITNKFQRKCDCNRCGWRSLSMMFVNQLTCLTLGSQNTLSNTESFSQILTQLKTCKKCWAYLALTNLYEPLICITAGYWIAHLLLDFEVGSTPRVL